MTSSCFTTMFYGHFTGIAISCACEITVANMGWYIIWTQSNLNKIKCNVLSYVCERPLSESIMTIIHWCIYNSPGRCELTHLPRCRIYASVNWVIIGSDSCLSPGRRQALIWTSAGVLFIRTLGTNFSEIWSEIHIFSFKTVHWKMSSAKWRPFCPGES